MSRLAPLDEALAPLDEALALYEALRTLGFLPDELLLVVTDDLTVCMGLRTQGKQLALPCGRWERSMDELPAAWAEKAEWWNTSSTHDAREALWRASYACNNAVALVTELVTKGFSLPRARAEMH